jgi:hypothetical protein
MKLCGGSAKNSFNESLNVDTFLLQAEELEREKQTNPMPRGVVGALNSAVATHPAPLSRATEIQKWARSATYVGLLARATNISE